MEYRLTEKGFQVLKGEVAGPGLADNGERILKPVFTHQSDNIQLVGAAIQQCDLIPCGMVRLIIHILTLLRHVRVVIILIIHK